MPLLDLVRDEEKRGRFSQNVLSAAWNDYSWDQISRRYLELA